MDTSNPTPSARINQTDEHRSLPSLSSSPNPLTRRLSRLVFLTSCGPTACVRWKNRAKALLAELERLDADVLAVQEMDQFEEFWAPWLERAGYGGVYKRRTQATAAKKDGCGLFFKHNKFELLAHRGLEYNDEAFGLGFEPGTDSEVTVDEGKDDDETNASPGASVFGVADADGCLDRKRIQCLLTSRARNDDSDAVAKLPEARKTHVRDCVGILAMLREKRVSYVGEASEKEKAAEGDRDEEKEERRKKPFLVASTHLFWDPAFPDVKLAQTERLLAETREFVRAFRKASGASGEKSAGDSPQKTSVPMIVAGDFNSVPGSDVHAAALRGVPGASPGTPGTPLKSAYAEALKRPDALIAKPSDGRDCVSADPTTGEPRHTNVTPGFTECIDYVFVSDDVVVVAAEPISGPAATFAGLPDLAHPSDHLPITVTLEY